jgi:hypothetical protein
MQQPVSDDWSVRQGRKGYRRRKPLGTPEGSAEGIRAADENRRLGSKTELEGWLKARAGGWPEGSAGRRIEGASRRAVGRQAEREAGGASRRSIGKPGRKV